MTSKRFAVSKRGKEVYGTFFKISYNELCAKR